MTGRVIVQPVSRSNEPTADALENARVTVIPVISSLCGANGLRLRCGALL
jgi:hypothetical protein